MPKRKLEVFQGHDDHTLSSSNKTPLQRRGGLDGIIDNGKKALCRAMRVSRGFERQKLGRRQKTAKEQNVASETARLAEEVTALKNLDLLLTSETHLYKSLMKSKPISTHPSFPSYVAKQLAQPFEHPDASSANVIARLFNANPVKAVIADILASVHKELGIPSDERPRKKKRLRAADFKDQSLVRSSKASKDSSKAPDTAVVRESDNHVQSSHTSPSDELGGQHTIKSDDESVDYNAYESRLASSEDESDVLREGGVKLDWSKSPSHEDLPQETQQTIPTYDPFHSFSPSSSIPSQSPTPPSSRPVPKPLKAASLPKAPTKQTTFLPSLIGGYWSGSESAPEDEDLSALKPRKNRRGQQERRAIWEKKFGNRAKHIQHQSQGRPQDRDHGWDAKRGARDIGDPVGRRKGGTKIGRGGRAERKGRVVMRSGANSDPIGVRKGAEKDGKRKGQAEGPLHPSWEAKKKAKEKTGSNVVPFQGKKVVFD